MQYSAEIDLQKMQYSAEIDLLKMQYSAEIDLPKMQYSAEIDLPKMLRPLLFCRHAPCAAPLYVSHIVFFGRKRQDRGGDTLLFGGKFSFSA